MLSLIILLFFGAGVAYLSLQNSALVSLSFLTYTIPPVPLYYVIIGSMIVGVIGAYLIYLSYYISTSLTIYNKDKQIKQDSKQLVELTKDNHKLVIENAVLKKDVDPDSFDHKSL